MPVLSCASRCVCVYSRTFSIVDMTMTKQLFISPTCKVAPLSEAYLLCQSATLEESLFDVTEGSAGSDWYD